MNLQLMNMMRIVYESFKELAAWNVFEPDGREPRLPS